MFRTNICQKHVELNLKINKYCYLLHLVGLDFITLLVSQISAMCLAPKCIIIKTICVCVCVWPIWDVNIVLQLCLDGINSDIKCLYYS
jgi:hypothetical protein